MARGSSNFIYKSFNIPGSVFTNEKLLLEFCAYKFNFNRPVRAIRTNSLGENLEIMILVESGQNAGYTINKNELCDFYIDKVGSGSLSKAVLTIDEMAFSGNWTSVSSKNNKDNDQATFRKQSELLRQLTSQLGEAKSTIEEQNKVLENIAKEPLLLFNIDRISRDNKHAFIKKGDQTIRVEVVKDLEPRDEVLCHPKTMQIVERVGKPPLEVSRFAPDKVPNVKWDDIGGQEMAKRDLIEAIEMPHKHKDLFKFYNQRQIKGILLEGPPGCGKTMMGKAVAHSLASIYDAEQSRTGFLYVKGPEILNMYVGASEETIRDMFYDARRHHEEHGYPAVIFIDEADAVMAARGGKFGGMGSTVVPMFLTEMDGLEESSAIVIIATNRPDILDPAIVRDGRIDRKIRVSRPTVHDAHKIIGMNLSKHPIARGFELEVLSEDMANEFYSTERYVKGDKLLRDIVNGAMLASCVDQAVSSAIFRDIASGKKEGLVPEDLLYAIDRIQAQNQTVLHDMEEAV